MLKRTDKEAVISELQQNFAAAGAAFVVKYQGVPVTVLESLRVALRSNQGRLRVTKARLMKRAVSDQPGGQQFSELLNQQIGLVFANSEVSAVAKTVIEYSTRHAALEVVTGFFSGKVLSREDIAFFASLPSREVLLGQVAGTLQAPIASFARVLNMLIVRLLYVLQRISEQKAA